MKWRDEAIVLGGRRFGEGGLILDVLTKTRGRRSGLVYGGASRKKRAQYEPGNTLEVSWLGRLEQQLGRFDVAEPSSERATRLLDAPDALAAISSMTVLLRDALDEGDAAGSSLYAATEVVLNALEDAELWPALYARWELGLLAALGFGLDLSKCALSGAEDELTHVSPKTGRAVRGSEAEGYLDRLLVLPPFMIEATAQVQPGDILAGLTLTGHFLEQRLFAAVHKTTPDARLRLVRRLQKLDET